MDPRLRGQLGQYSAYRVLHRGGNELDRLRQAARAGLDAAEVDLWPRAGEVLVRHAKPFAPASGLLGRLAAFSGLGAPTLDQVAELAERTGIALFLDLKSDELRYCSGVLQILRRFDRASTALVSSQNWHALENVETLDPTVPVLFSVDTPGQWDAIERLRTDRPVAGVSINQQRLNRWMIVDLRDRDIRVFAWTVDDAERAVDLLEWGVDGLISGSIELLAAIRAPTVNPRRWF